LDVVSVLFDLKSGGQIARRVLDVLGPRPEVRDRLLDLADRHGDAGLAILVLERAAAARPQPSAELFVELAKRRTGAGDFDGAAQELLRAVELECDAQSVLAATDELTNTAQKVSEERQRTGAPSMRSKSSPVGVSPSGLGSDGLIAIAEARARALHALARSEGQGSSRLKDLAAAWRALGVMRWDLAADRRGGELALFAAAEAAGDGAAFAQYARDLC
jgi:hypothetical protein